MNYGNKSHVMCCGASGGLISMFCITWFSWLDAVFQPAHKPCLNLLKENYP